MLFSYELKKLWRRVSPISVLIVLLVTSILTISISAVVFNKAPTTTVDVTAQYATLANKLNNWNTTLNRESFAEAFNNFYADFKKMNTSTFNGDGLVEDYKTAQISFNKFYVEYYQYYINGSQTNIANYLLVQKKYIKDLHNILTTLDGFFQADYLTKDGIIQGLKYTNSAWEDADLETILEDLFYVQKIDENDLTKLKEFIAKYPTEQEGFDYTDAYEYLTNQYWTAIESASTYTGHLSEYEGFSDYKDAVTSQQACKLAGYRLQHSEKDFAQPFTFGNIFNQQGNQVSLFDFVFTNMEMAMIMVAILVMIWAASAFFTDTYQNTLITPITAGKNRSHIIVTKMMVVMLLAISTILIFTGIYLTAGVLIFRAYVSPDILFLFNGTTTVAMSAINYYVIYFLSLFFKLLPLIAVCGLVSFAKAKPFIIIGLTTLVYIIVATLNYCLGGFSFYQYVPLLALNPINYLGAQSMLSTMPNTFNLWYTLPPMLAITVILYLLLIQKFRHHDFY